MTGRAVPKKITLAEQGPLSASVEKQLAKDREALKHSNVIRITRSMCLGEAEPYVMNPAETRVEVSQAGRQFIVDGKATLFIINPIGEKERFKKKHLIMSIKELQAERSARRKAKAEAPIDLPRTLEIVDADADEHTRL